MDETYKERIERYLKSNLKKGYSEDSLKWALIKQGHSRTEVSRAIEKVKGEISDQKEKENAGKDKPIIKYELYDKDNNPIGIGRKPFSIRGFFRDLFS